MKSNRLAYTVCALTLVLNSFYAPDISHAASAPKLLSCITSKGEILVRTKKCKRGETLLNIQALQAIQPSSTGPQGPQGSDGQLRIYGNGSRGDFVAASGVLNTLDSANLQFENFTVPAGTSVIVPSGAVIRVRGNLVNHGFIVIEQGLVFATGFGNLPSNASYFGQSAYSGGFAAAIVGSSSSSAVGISGSGGRGMTVNVSNQARMAIRTTTVGGGSGGNGSGGGGSGGGSATILAKGSIVNSATGVIYALGGDSFGGSTSCGGGGGAGGMLVVASMTSITNAGEVRAYGGKGTDATSIQIGAAAFACGAGGGSGGGLVHFLAPVINETGSVNVQPGASGSVPLESLVYGGATTFNTFGGGGGGACFGGGGNGATVTANAVTKKFTFAPVGAANLGEPGLVVRTVTDPTSLF